MSENFVLGGGLAGLIYAYYNKDFKVLTDKIGGQSVGTFTLGPRIIQEHDATRKLLKDLGFRSFGNASEYDFRMHKKPMLIKKANIGYFNDGVVQAERPDLEYRKAYYAKSRCIPISDTDKIPEAVMSENKSSISYFTISHEQLAMMIVEELRKENRIFVAKVQQVDIDEKLIHVFADGGVKTMPFDKLVNTAPFPIFFSLCNPTQKLEGTEFEYEPKYFINADKYDFRHWISEGFDYIYYADSKPWHRITVGETNVIVELTGKAKYEEFHKDWSHLVWTAQELKIGQIKQNFNCVTMEVDNVTIPHIRNIGRFAAWNHEVKTQQVVESALKGLW